MDAFDLLHIGHVKYLQAAKTLGHFLIVTIIADRFINKGPGRPLFSELHRQEILQALKCVDVCEINYAPTAVPMIEKYKPDIYCKGQDYKQSTRDLELERQAVESYGGRLIILTTEPQYSSTQIMTGKTLQRKISV